MLDQDPPPGIHPGIYRAEVITSHNLSTHPFLQPENYESPMGTIAKRQMVPVDTLEETMVFYPWREVYGLSYVETQNLPYSTWIRLLNKIKNKYPKGRESFNKQNNPSPTNKTSQDDSDK